ncbi:hypothetical protein AB0N89_33885 [Amycolatopsis sp. NPDC089917]|uniref:hypothetical protein n=1 Tax=Amycolatopsis sp. NPDC089917 TaxID=3155187 RepID=UPI0034433CC1
MIIVAGVKPLCAERREDRPALTNEPAQWVDRSSISGDREEWQSKRDPDAWSHGGGETCYFASETGSRYQATVVP